MSGVVKCYGPPSQDASLYVPMEEAITVVEDVLTELDGTPLTTLVGNPLTSLP